MSELSNCHDFRPHPNPRIEAMAKASYEAWTESLFGQPAWERASSMAREKFYRMIRAALQAAVLASVADRKAA